MEKLHGVITSMLTPFTQGGALDEETLAGELEHQLRCGVDGLCILGGTGESLSLTAEERLRVVETAVGVVAGRAPVIVGCFAPQEAELIAFARAAHDRGASAMMLTPPPFYKVTAFHFQRLLERISAACDIPLVLYNAPRRAGVRLTSDEVCGLVRDVPAVVGVKDATGDVPDLARLAHGLDPRCGLLQGLDDVFLPSLAAGASGGILALASVLPERFVAMYRGWKSGDVQNALALQMSVLPLMQVVNSEPMPVLVKEAMAAVGRPMGPTRPPLYPPDPGVVRDLHAAVDRLLAA